MDEFFFGLSILWGYPSAEKGEGYCYKVIYNYEERDRLSDYWIVTIKLFSSPRVLFPV